jgi:ABC-2 type transport system ATP-binding protein
MTVIRTTGLSRTFTVRVKPEGLKPGLKALFRPEYRQVEAVRNISLEVQAGESLAFLGPNGAGKSTTIKLLCGILRASGGLIEVLGFDPARDRQKLAYSIGSVFGQKSQLWYHLPAADSFRLLGAVYEIEPAVLKRRSAELSERFGLAGFLDLPVRKLSLGQRIRCEIAASLLHKPRLLFLDEPTIGLDVVAKQEIRNLLEEWNRDEQVTLFLTSHDIGDVERLCRRAVLIHHGTLVMDEALAALKRQASAKKIIGVRYVEPTAIQLDGLEAKMRSACAATFEVDTARHNLQAVMSRLVALGEVADLTVEDEPLENLIADLYRSHSHAELTARLGQAEGQAAAGGAGSAGALTARNLARELAELAADRAAHGEAGS